MKALIFMATIGLSGLVFLGCQGTGESDVLPKDKIEAQGAGTLESFMAAVEGSTPDSISALSMGDRMRQLDEILFDLEPTLNDRDRKSEVLSSLSQAGMLLQSFQKASSKPGYDEEHKGAMKEVMNLAQAVSSAQGAQDAYDRLYTRCDSCHNRYRD